ncbi:MAG: translation initiation factor IF-2 [Flavobacteriales bacterium]|jgi:translation initiation factor IF-2|nr:translation initiation factor IF-2 [Flavobacteriales bacterium]
MSTRLSKAAREFNVSIDRLAETLASNGHEIVARPTTKISDEQYNILVEKFQSDLAQKKKSVAVSNKIKEEKEVLKNARKASEKAKEEPVAKEPAPKTETPAAEETPKKEEKTPETPAPKVEEKPAPVVEKKEEPKVEEKKEEPTKETPKEQEMVSNSKKLQGPKQVGKVDLEPKKPKKTAPKKEEPVAKKEAPKKEEVKPEQKEAPKKTTKPAKVKKDVELIKARGNKLQGLKTVGTIDEINASNKKNGVSSKDEELIKKQLQSKLKTAKKEAPKTEEKPEAKTPEKAPEPELIKAKAATLSGPKMTGQKIDLSQFNKPKKKVASSAGKTDDKNKKKKRKRISKPGENNQKNNANPNNRNQRNNRNTQGGGRNNNQNRNNNNRKGKKPAAKAEEPTDAEIQKRISDTLSRLTNKSKNKGAKYRRSKRDERREKEEIAQQELAAQSKVIKVTEFVTVNELATMMDVSITEVISSCMMLGLMVTMNQRLDGETLQIVAEEFGFTVEFVSADVQEAIEEEVDNEDDLLERAPIVTVMGHVDHGKTSLLDHIREANVIAGEAGGITQHIGSYHVELESGKMITFIDTPGHEAFTAMRARGAKVTDVVIIVISATDRIMPQTKEAIAHAQAAEVPMIFAINKVDLPDANPDKIKEELAGMNLLVEDWGGKFQSQEVSAKTGLGVSDLLEKVLLESELLELKANPKRKAKGAIIEASLDKGKGYITNILVQNGTLSIGDFILSGQYYGKVKAMQDERGQLVKTAGPSVPVSILGLNGAPQAGDDFHVMSDEKEAKSIATKRTQLQREQAIRTQKHVTLEVLAQRMAIGDFQELNLIVKGDVDGSIEALADSLQKLSTESIQVNIIHKAVGQISDSDVLLASASNAIIVGFQVRPSGSARKIAENEDVEIRTYSIIYDAINEIKEAMEGMLAPKFKEEIIGQIVIRETFKISKVGTIAGCYVMTGKITRNSSVRLIRDGIVKYDGKLGSLKRFKDDVKEVTKGFECGLNIENYNDIIVGDEIEVYEQVEVKQKLK